MARLVTPRQILAEIKSGTDRPFWVGKVFGEVEQLLAAMGVIDQFMSASSIEALLEEVVDRALRPATEAELLADFQRMMPEGSA